MTKNLNVSKFRNGEAIPEAKAEEEEWDTRRMLLYNLLGIISISIRAPVKLKANCTTGMRLMIKRISFCRLACAF